MIIAAAILGWRANNQTTTYGESDSSPALPTQPAAVNSGVDGKAMMSGSADAPVTIVEYADFLCPYCAKYTNEVEPDVRRNYISTGKVKFVFRPMAYIAGDSARAAAGGYCAADQGKFWDYHDYVYKKTWSDYYSQGMKPDEVTLFRPDNTKSLATAAGLDSDASQLCVDSGKYSAAVKQATDEAHSRGISGTPHFLINDRDFTGFAPYSVVKTTIESFL